MPAKKTYTVCDGRMAYCKERQPHEDQLTVTIFDLESRSRLRFRVHYDGFYAAEYADEEHDF